MRAFQGSSRLYKRIGHVAQRGVERIAQGLLDRALMQHKGNVLDTLEGSEGIGRRRLVGRDFGSDAVDRRGNVGELAGLGLGTVRRWLAAKRRLDARDGADQDLRVGVAIATGVFGQKTAAALGRHDGDADGVVIRRVWETGQYVQQRRWVVGHRSTTRDQLKRTTAEGAIRPCGRAAVPRYHRRQIGARFSRSGRPPASRSRPTSASARRGNSGNLPGCPAWRWRKTWRDCPARPAISARR